MRVGDSEPKILDNLARKLGNNTAAKGSVTIFTERAACSSCLGSLSNLKLSTQIFRLMFG
ncbi:deaminase domain-containing protein [Pseudomonas indica]|uniref:deaminase domain-containing protein n=1 Tax=Pseudomonas indica TaxID=137658 RepID=UPI003CC7A5F2